MKRGIAQESLHEDISRQHQVERGTSKSLGLVFAGVFGIVALFPLWSGESVRVWAVGIAVAFLVAALVWPKVLDPLNHVWFRFGLLLHAMISPIVLGLLFYIVISPIGLLMRLLGKDPLRLSLQPKMESYWIERSPPGPAPESMRHQF